MNDIREAFTTFAGLFLRDGPAQNGATAARELLETYPDDPQFWLQYARVCLGKEAFLEGSLALRRVSELQAKFRNTEAGAPGLEPFLQAVQWKKMKIYTDMLNIAVRGTPGLLSKLIHELQSMGESDPRTIRRELDEALDQMHRQVDSNPAEASKWGVWLESLRLRFNEIENPDNSGITDLLVFHLMCAGRYSEAEALLRGGPTPRSAAPAPKPWYPSLLEWLNDFRANPLRQVTSFVGGGHRYLLGVAVWGDAYLDSLEHFTLPSLLAPGNLPALQASGDIRLVIFTNEAGAARLAKMPVLVAARAFATVDIIPFPSALSVRPEIYKLMSALHLACMEIAKATQAHFCFIPPDLVFSHNLLERVDQRMQAGAEVVFVPGLILQMEPFEEEQSRRFPVENHVLNIPPRDLLALGMRHLHPFVRKNYTYTPDGRRSTVAVFLWPLANGGCVVHGYHHSPFMISATAMARFDGSMFQNIDGDFLPKILRTREEVERCAMITDPLETTYFELSRSHRFGEAVGADLGEFDLGTFDIERLARWGALLGETAQWLLPQKACFDPTGTAASDPAYAESDRVIQAMVEGIEHLKRNSSHLPLEIESV